MGLYFVFTEENHYMPEEIQQRNLIVGLALLLPYHKGFLGVISS